MLFLSRIAIFACMKLHIFNPDHDMALASNLQVFTAPHAARQLQSDLEYLPALWADEGDLVLVENVDNARDKMRHLAGVAGRKHVQFITPDQLASAFKASFLVDSIHPWGWNKALCFKLQRLGCPKIMLPTTSVLQRLRQISSRQWAASHLQQDVKFVDNVAALEHMMLTEGGVVIKAPWSCSGRGVRFYNAENNSAVCQDTLRWAQNVIAKQGGVTVEPYYNKVKDFGMEFEMFDGHVHYLGLSLFNTSNTAYSGNLLATEDAKEKIISRYIPVTQLQVIRQYVIDVMEPALKGMYNGAFGVDMMICTRNSSSKEILVNPCIEVNLRRTMGHLALALSKNVSDCQCAMQIAYTGNRYHLNVRKLNVNDEDIV